MKLLLPIALAAVLSACATAAPDAGRRSGQIIQPYASAGLERVIGQSAPGLSQLFGDPDADVREGRARKLQFSSGICVLDTYLYPKGDAEPRVTYVDARQPDGSPIDRASCVAALTRREGGK